MSKKEHKLKMENRRIEQNNRQPSRTKPILANISRNHKDYGVSPKEHESLKAERAKQNVW